MSIFMAMLLGIVQGITEFLPVSSSGHLSILQNLLKIGEDAGGHLFFDVLLHLGTLGAICVVYRKDLRAIITDTVGMLRGGQGDDFSGEGPVRPSVRLLIMIIVGTLPLFLALPFKNKLELLYYKTWFIGCVLVVTGALLYVTDRYVVSGRKNEKTMTVKDALIIGFAQMIALIPGLSRSGTTISVGQARGLDRDFSVRFSLLLSLPAVIGSTIITLLSALKAGIVWASVPAYLVGLVFAGVVGYFAIGFLRRMMAKGKFGRFAYYCVGLGILVIILSLILK